MRSLIPLFSIACFTCLQFGHASDATWKASNFDPSPNDEPWQDVTSWVGDSTFPNGVGEVATFPANTSNDKKTSIVQILAPSVTAGSIDIDEGGRDDYIFQGRNANNSSNATNTRLIFDNGNNDACLDAKDTSTDGRSIFNVKVVLNSDLIVKGGGNITWNYINEGPKGLTLDFPKASNGYLKLTCRNDWQGETCVNSGRLITTYPGALPAGTCVTVKRCGMIQHESSNILEEHAYKLKFDDSGSSYDPLGTVKIWSVTATVMCLEGNGIVEYSNHNDSVFQVCVPQDETCHFDGILKGNTNQVGNENHPDPCRGNAFVKLGAGEQTLFGTDAINQQFKPRFFVREGTLWIKKPRAIGAPPIDPCDPEEYKSNIFVHKGATLKLGLDGQNQTWNKIIRLNGLGDNGSGALRVCGENHFHGSIHVGWEVNEGKLKGLICKEGASIHVEQGGKFFLKRKLFGEDPNCDLCKTGPGHLEFLGNEDNPFKGDIFVKNGTLKFNKSDGKNATTGNITVQDSGCLQLGQNNQIPDTATLTIDGPNAKFTPNCGGSTFCDTIARLDFCQGVIVDPENPKDYLTLCDSDVALTLKNVTIPGKINIKACGDICYIPNLQPPQVLSGVQVGGVICNVCFQTQLSQDQPNIKVGNSCTKFDLVIKNSEGKTFCKTGPGQLLLSGTHTHTTGAPNKVLEGALCIGNDIIGPATFNGDIEVHNGATLCGDGIITVPNCLTIKDGGVLEPGDCEHGTLCVNGNVKFEANSRLCLEINSKDIHTTPETDLLKVDGSVTIDPSAKLEIKVLPNTLHPFDENFCVTLIDATGTLDDFQLGCIIKPALINLTVVEQTDPDNKLQLKLSLPPCNEPPILLTPNPNPPEIIDHFFAVLGSCPQVQQLLMAIEGYSMEELVAVIEELDPSLVKSQHIVDQNNAFRQRTALTRRMNDLHRLACHCEDTQRYHANFWTEWSWDSYDQKPMHMERGFQAQTGYLQGGLDILNGEGWLVGFATGFAFSNIEWRRAASSGAMQGGTVSFYTSKYGQNLWINAAVQGGTTHNEYHRFINIPELQKMAKGKYYVHHALTHLGLGYIWNMNENFEIRPFARADYIYQKSDGYCEKDLACLALEVRHISAHVLRSEGGIEFAYCVPQRNTAIKAIVDGKVSFVREDRFTGKKMHARAAGTFGGFSVRAMNPDHNLISPALGIAFMSPCDTFHVRFGYEGEFGSKHTVHYGNAKVGVDF